MDNLGAICPVQTSHQCAVVTTSATNRWQLNTDCVSNSAGFRVFGDDIKNVSKAYKAKILPC